MCVVSVRAKFLFVLLKKTGDRCLSSGLLDTAGSYTGSGFHEPITSSGFSEFPFVRGTFGHADIVRQ